MFVHDVIIDNLMPGPGCPKLPWIKIELAVLVWDWVHLHICLLQNIEK
jgi:hypothetical protein